MSRLSKYSLILMLMIAHFSGCAYFNAFYLAQRNFNDGEYQRLLNEGVPNTASMSNYRSAVVWARDVLEEYPDSKYIDDSMFIIGMSQYYQNDFVLARSQFDELLRVFPDSEYRDETNYFKAMSYIGLNQFENAMIVLDELLLTDDPVMKNRGGLAFARIAEQNEKWDELLKSADSVLEMDPDKKELVEATVYRGEALYQLERFEDCVAALEPLRSIKKIDLVLRFRSTTRLAQSYAELDNYDTALSYLTELADKGEFTPYHDELSLEKGYIYQLQGNEELAINTYRDMAATYEDSVASRDAWYRVGVIILKDIAFANDAKEAFVNVGDQPRNVKGSYFVDAKQKITNIDSLSAHLDRIDDYQDNLDELVKTRFSLGGLYTFMFDRPDSASGQYEIIMRDAPGTEFAIMSDFYLRRFAAMVDGDIDAQAERETAESVIAEYPESDFATTLRNYIGVEDNTPHVLALKKAEAARINGSSWEDYLPLYQETVDNFPDTRSSYQARLVMAYYYEHEAGDSEKALEIYRDLADEEPSFISQHYIESAREKLTYYEEEPKLLEEIRTYIADFEIKRDESRQELSLAQSSSAALAGITDNGFSGMRKIRARNARIRSRYYTD